ncbi:MAG: DUF1330 domain-containing protein [Xanthobacteraceae bacterium]
MQAKPIVALAIGSFALGAVAVQTLHAQAKPPAFVMAEIAVKDEDGYKKDFLPDARKIIMDHGGKYLGGGFNKTIAYSGAAPANRIVLLQFENMDAVKAWWDGGGGDIEKKVGSKYATFRTLAIEGVTP